MSSLYPPLKRLPHKARNNLIVKFYPSKTAYERAIPRLLDIASPGYFVAKDIFDRMPANQLNWRIVTNVSAKDVPHAIARNRIKRRYYSAFDQALKEKGYRSNGKLRSDSDSDSDSNTPQKGNTPRQPLKGTLEILVFQKTSSDVAFDRLRSDAARVLDAVCMHQQQDTPDWDGFTTHVREKETKKSLPRQKKTFNFKPR